MSQQFYARLACIAATLFYPAVMLGQSTDFFKLQRAYLHSVVHKGEFVEFAVRGPEPFYVGGDTYYLKIGSVKFGDCRQTNLDGRGLLQFTLPFSSFRKLAGGDSMFVYWGQTLDLDQKNPGIHYNGESKYLGLFSPEILTRH